MADGKVCAFQLTTTGAWLPTGVTAPLTFDASTIGSATPPVINFNQILVSNTATSPALAAVNSPAGLNSNSAVIKTIQITNITGPATGNTFSAKFQVTFDSDKLVRSLSPVYIHSTLLTSGTGNTKTITGCLSEGSALDSGGSWQCSFGIYQELPTSICVRITDGQVCYQRPLGFPNNKRWYCQAADDPSYPWPGAGQWQCNVANYDVHTYAVCVRITDGHTCYRTPLLPVSSSSKLWYCQAADDAGAPWPN